MKAKVEGDIKITGENGQLIAMSFFNTPINADSINTLNQICDASAIVMSELVQRPEYLAKTIQGLIFDGKQ